MRSLAAMLSAVQSKKPNEERRQQFKGTYHRKGSKRRPRAVWKQERDQARELDRAHDEAIKEEAYHEIENSRCRQ